MHLLDPSPSECWKPLRLLGSVLTSKVWSIQEQNLGAQTGTYEEGHCRWCNIWDSVGAVGSVLRHRLCIQGLRAGSVAVHHLMDGTGGAVSVGKWGGRQLQKQSSSHTHTNPNKMCNLSNTALFKDCQRLSLSVLHRCLHLDTQIRKLPESNQQFTSWLNTRRPQSLHDQQQFHLREINADKTQETKKDGQKSGLHLSLLNSNNFPISLWGVKKPEEKNMKQHPSELCYCY